MGQLKVYAWKKKVKIVKMEHADWKMEIATPD